MNRCVALGGMFLFLVLIWSAVLGEPGQTQSTPPLSQDEQTLKQAGVALDNAGLLDYFQRRTPSSETQERLRERVAQLGSTTYQTRARATDELIRAGRSALPALRLAMNHKDAETARRCRHCIRLIEQNTHLSLSALAARVLAQRQAPGTVEVLLAYLPFIDEESVEEEIRQSLKQLALSKGQAAVVLEGALGDKEPKRRGAAGWIVAQSGDAGQRQKVLPLLQDEAVEVRFLAASALLFAKEVQAVPALIRLLSDGPAALAWRAEDLLFRLAGEAGPAVWLDAVNDNQGRKARAAWETWWKTHEAKLDWKSLRLDEQTLGLTLVIENQRGDGAGRIYECNPQGHIRWQVRSQNPIDAQWLPGGRLLVADSQASLVYEMDPRGTIGWKYAGLSPTSCQRLPNGNTVIATYQSIVEITRAGNIVFSYKTPGHTYHARKLSDGRYVWIDACGEIGAIDDTGKELARHSVGNGLTWGSIEKLRNGHFLVALGGINKVQEMDLDGKIYWEKKVSNPNRTIRLANGRILVASHGDQCVYEFDAQGQERWKHACSGRPFAIQRR